MNISNPETVATKKDLIQTKEELLGKWAFKDELKQEASKLATKKELIQTKETLLNKVTSKDELKQEVSKLATRKELYEVEHRLDARLTRVEIAVVDIQQHMKGLETKEDANKKFNILVGMIEALTARMDAGFAERATLHHALNRHDNQLADHEKRISRLES